MNKHSEGTWTFEPRHIVPGYMIIAKPRPDAIGRVVAELPKYAGVEEDDAHLISAAPDLLEALRNLIVARDLGFPPFAREIESARAALAKAEGRVMAE